MQNFGVDRHWAERRQLLVGARQVSISSGRSYNQNIDASILEQFHNCIMTLRMINLDFFNSTFCNRFLEM